MRKFLPLFCLLILWLVGCKPQVPSDYIQPGEMEDILYDYHIAQAMADVGGDQVKREAYEDAVLRKHGVSRKQFDESLHYYMRHTDRLHDIYEDLAHRLQNEAVAQGSSVNETDHFGNIAASGDTANIWRQSTSVVLLNSQPLNLRTFSIKADSSFHKGDHFVLEFKSQYIIQSGMRNVVVVLSAKYANDSVSVHTCYAATDNTLSIIIDDTGRLGIKELRGYFIMPQEKMQDAGQSMKLFVAQDIRLVKMHTEEPKPVPQAPADSTRKDSMPRPQPAMPGEPAPVPTTPTPRKQ